MAADIVLILIGFVLCFLIIRSRAKTKHLRQNGALANGTIVDFWTPPGKKDSGNYPVVRFTTEANQTVDAKSNEGYASMKIKKGRKVTVLYNTVNPQDFTIKMPKEKTMFITVLIGAIIFTLGGIVLLLNQLSIIHLLKK